MLFGKKSVYKKTTLTIDQKLIVPPCFPQFYPHTVWYEQSTASLQMSYSPKFD